ncbi:unnamed protein product [Cuscuta epithymum]|uniref:Uncharacterized protein n=1 Tax=Cuscuta epithymum TaxID=186058 RepID=A0AAV0C8Z3_9ASTE|nr:unnamed protein product [Cuscuta epithymum]
MATHPSKEDFSSLISSISSNYDQTLC